MIDSGDSGAEAHIARRAGPAVSGETRTVTAPTDQAPNPHVSRLRRAWGVLGPGLVTGASDDDPSGIATYAQAGAQYGFGLLWTALITL